MFLGKLSIQIYFKVQTFCFSVLSEKMSNDSNWMNICIWTRLTVNKCTHKHLLKDMGYPHRITSLRLSPQSEVKILQNTNRHIPWKFHSPSKFWLPELKRNIEKSSTPKEFISPMRSPKYLPQQGLFPLRITISPVWVYSSDYYRSTDKIPFPQQSWYYLQKVVVKPRIQPNNS